MKDDARKHQKRPYYREEQHQQRRTQDDVVDDEIGLNHERGESGCNGDQDQPGNGEREQRPVELDAAQHAREHLQPMTDRVRRRTPDIVANPDVYFLYAQLRTCRVYKHLAVDRHLVGVEVEKRCGLHRERAKTALRIGDGEVAVEPEMDDLVENHLPEPTVARRAARPSVQVAASVDDVGLVAQERPDQLRDVIRVVLTVAIDNDEDIETCLRRVRKRSRKAAPLPILIS